MPKFVIEREIPGAGALTAEQFEGNIAEVLRRAAANGTSIEWVESFVTDNKIYCVYVARRRTASGGLPSGAARASYSTR
jgi:hypothetical protein